MVQDCYVFFVIPALFPPDLDDFSLADTSIEIAPGPIPTTIGTNCISVSGNTDSLFEAVEDFNIVITGTNQSDVVSVGAMNTTTISIINNHTGMCTVYCYYLLFAYPKFLQLAQK